VVLGEKSMTDDSDDWEAYLRNLEHERNAALDEAAALFEVINPASDDERMKGDPGAGAMGAIIEYRNKIRALKRT
jgi:hypothetical protein